MGWFKRLFGLEKKVEVKQPKKRTYVTKELIKLKKLRPRIQAILNTKFPAKLSEAKTSNPAKAAALLKKVETEILQIESALTIDNERGFKNTTEDLAQLKEHLRFFKGLKRQLS